MSAVTLGVVAYHDPRSLDRLLASASGFDDVVVANVEGDGGVAAVCERHGARVVVVPGNPGYAAAVSRLAEQCRTRFLLFGNDDVRFPDGAADRARAAARRGGVVAPRLLEDDGSVMPSVRALPTPGRVLLELVVLPDDGPSSRRVQKWRRPETVEPVDAVTAAAVLVDVEVVRRHPLPTEYVMYWEEISWFWRLRDHGVPVVLDPSLEVLRSGGRGEMGPAKWRRMGANLVRLGAERYGLMGRLGYALLGTLWIARLFVTDLVRGDRRRRWAARRAALAGVLQAAWKAA